MDSVVARPPPARGAVVAVADGDRRAFGWGFYNPDSPLFRVRVMALAGQEQQQQGGGEETPPFSSSPFDVGALVRRRVSAAAALRRSLGLPRRGVTTAYRLVNSEGDRLSGLVVDALGGDGGGGEDESGEGGKVQGGSLVVASSAAWCEEHRAAIEEALIAETGGEMKIVWTRSAAMMREEGVEEEVPGEEGAGGEGGVEEEEEAEEPESEKKETIVLENGLRFLVTPGKGQKTGFYADQRESRLFVRQLVEAATLTPGKKFRVLDLCCFHGGFALSAAKGGASEVVGVDSSAPALEVARENARLNGFGEEKVRFERGDAGDFLSRATARARDDATSSEAGSSSSSSAFSFDLIVLDPPKLAPTRASLPAALRRYQSLNTAAMRLLLANSSSENGGLLMTCSCSGAVAAAGAFEPMLAAAAARAGARISVLRVAGAAPCHALDPSYPEGKYLTNVLLRVTRA